LEYQCFKEEEKAHKADQEEKDLEEEQVEVQEDLKLDAKDAEPVTGEPAKFPTAVQGQVEKQSQITAHASCISLSPSKLPPTGSFDKRAALIGEPITWMSGNQKTQVAIRIPNTSTQKVFKEHAKKTKWVEKVCDNINRNADTKEEKDEAIGWLLEEIMSKSPDAFQRIACKHGYIPADMSRMSATYTNAMLKESNNNAKQARIISRFLKYWYN
jgi:hypothetical protein